MHITESRQQPTNILTKCSKMTEEGHRRHGMNGNADGGPGIIKEECPRNIYNQGGRLKFFKDGKFILELESAREGERVSWVSVPRKIFWPPQGNAASTPTYRQESSASLSVSDDNSSIQSSPWQRDHSWKQTAPRRNLSKELIFFYWRPKHLILRKVTLKRRQPYNTTLTYEDLFSNVVKSERTDEDSVCNKKINKVKFRVRPSLLTIVQILTDKSVSNTPPRAEMIVSPRKRFLRDLDKDKVLLEDACQKRSRNKTVNSTSVSSIIPSTKVSSPVRVNGTTEEVRVPRNCSYSITSLLAEDRISRRSPDDSPSHFSSVTQAHYCSPQTDDRWYSESVDRLRSIELSQADKRAMSGYHPTYPYVPPYMYPYSMPHYYPPGVYGRNYMVPPVYSAPPVPLPVRHDTPSCSWTAELPRETENREENIADMPLNLSKHAG